MSGQTPGPWQAVEHYSDCLTVVDADGFEHVKAAHIAILLDYEAKLGIPHWADSPKASREISPEEQAANARLIAAAPALLAELENIANADPAKWDAEVRDQFREWAQNRARAALARLSPPLTREQQAEQAGVRG